MRRILMMAQGGGDKILVEIIEVTTTNTSGIYGYTDYTIDYSINPSNATNKNLEWRLVGGTPYIKDAYEGVNSPADWTEFLSVTHINDSQIIIRVNTDNIQNLVWLLAIATDGSGIYGGCRFNGLNDMAQEDTLLPEGYTQLAYLQSSGTQQIDTGYDPVKNTIIEIGYEYTSISSSTLYYVFGNYNAARKNSTRLIKTTSKTYINMFTSTDYNNFILNVSSAANVRYDEVLTNTSYTTNGVTYEITDTTEGTSNARNLALFANHCLSGNRKTSMKLYYCRIKEGDTLVCDFVPCLDADGVACLYDTVSKETHYNGGTGAFGYGTIE